MEKLQLDSVFVYNNFVYVDDENEIISLTSDGYIVKYNLTNGKPTKSDQTYINSSSNDRHHILTIANNNAGRFVICQDDSYKICWINYNNLKFDWKSSENQSYHYVLECLPNGNIVSLNRSGEVHVYQYKIEKAIYSQTETESFYSEDSYKPLGVINNNIVVTQSNKSRNILLLHYLNAGNCIKFQTEIDTWIHCIKNYPENDSDFLVLYDNKKIVKYTIGSQTPELIAENGHNGNGWKCLIVSRKGIIGYVNHDNTSRLQLVYNGDKLKSIECPIALHFIEFTHDENIIFSQSKLSIYHITNPLKQVDYIFNKGTYIFLSVKYLEIYDAKTSSHLRTQLPNSKSWMYWLSTSDHEIIAFSGNEVKIIEFRRESTNGIKIHIRSDPFYQTNVILLGIMDTNINDIVKYAKEYPGLDRGFKIPGNNFQNFVYNLIQKSSFNKKTMSSNGYLAVKMFGTQFHGDYSYACLLGTVFSDTIREIFLKDSATILNNLVFN